MQVSLTEHFSQTQFKKKDKLPRQNLSSRKNGEKKNVGKLSPQNKTMLSKLANFEQRRIFLLEAHLGEPEPHERIHTLGEVYSGVCEGHSKRREPMYQVSILPARANSS